MYIKRDSAWKINKSTAHGIFFCLLECCPECSLFFPFVHFVRQATEASVTSLVLNDDVIPRMSWQSIEMLADQVGGENHSQCLEVHGHEYPRIKR